MYIGGGHGGANPPTSLSQAVFPPQEGVPWAWAGLEARLGQTPDAIPLGAMGATPKGANPEGQPPAGGNTLARRLGAIVHPTGVVPLRVVLPRMAPLILGVSLVIRYRCLPIVRTFLGDLVGILVIRRVLLHDY